MGELSNNGPERISKPSLNPPRRDRHRKIAARCDEESPARRNNNHQPDDEDEGRQPESSERSSNGIERRRPAPARSIPDDDTGAAMITLRVDTQVLARVDAAAKRLGINRTAWLHLAAEGLLGDRR